MPSVAPYPFEIFVTFGWIGFFLVLGVYLRAKIPFLRKYLVPASIIGGVLAFLLFNIFGLLQGTSFGYSPTVIENIAFHFFGLYFGCNMLAGMGGGDKGKSSAVTRHTAGGLVCISTQMLCSTLLAGSLAILMLLLNMFIGTNYVESTGQLLATGFIAGPGPAMTTGAVWEKTANIPGLTALGLTSGSLGFLVAFAIGIPMANHYRKKAYCSTDITAITSPEERRGYYEGNGPSVGKQTTMPANLETIASYFFIVFMVYFIGYLIAMGLVALLPPAVAPVVWAIFFVMPIPAALFVRKVLQLLKLEHLIDQQLNTRVAGGLIDIIVISSFFGMTLAALQQFGVFIVLGILIILAVLLITIPLICRSLPYETEHILYLTGTLTGTVATGLFLCRMIDPEQHNPMPFEAAMSGVFTLATIPLAPVGHLQILFGWSIFSWVGLQFAMAATWLVILFFARTWYKKTYMGVATHDFMSRVAAGEVEEC